MARVLILFASHHGQTRAIADRVARRLRAAAHIVDVIDVRNGPRRPPTPTEYDLVVLGSRIELGSHARDIRQYIRSHREALRRCSTAFFSVSMSATEPNAGPDPQGYMAKLFAQVGWQPTWRIAFGGGLPYLKYGPVTRLIMKWISAREGHPTDTTRNHDCTDWPRVDQFGDELVAALPRQRESIEPNPAACVELPLPASLR